ncbi:hypothetical protein [Thioclava kandeliae]|uniref:Uncharacterized protein n=1 Tax=Thioclava kandeliae TaxID=3070818 RepID=A0ABV1SL90_9RHOB
MSFILPTLCKKRSEVIRLVPDVKSTLAKKVLEEVLLLKGGRINYNGLLLEPADRQGALLQDSYALDRLTPNGARLLKKLFLAGMIDQRHKTSNKDVFRLDRYIRSEPEIIDRSMEILRKRTLSHDEWRDVIESADLLLNGEEVELTSHVVDRVFINKFGFGASGRIDIGGYRLFRYVGSSYSFSPEKFEVLKYAWWVCPKGKLSGAPPMWQNYLHG